MTEDKKKDIFAYLDDLRDSGECNMFGAGPYVEATFGMSRREARTVVVEWMESFEG